MTLSGQSFNASHCELEAARDENDIHGDLSNTDVLPMRLLVSSAKIFYRVDLLPNTGRIAHVLLYQVTET